MISRPLTPPGVTITYTIRENKKYAPRKSNGVRAVFTEVVYDFLYASISESILKICSWSDIGLLAINS